MRRRVRVQCGMSEVEVGIREILPSFALQGSFANIGKAVCSCHSSLMMSLIECDHL